MPRFNSLLSFRRTQDLKTHSQLSIDFDRIGPVLLSYEKLAFNRAHTLCRSS
jgi:hypothetical protein